MSTNHIIWFKDTRKGDVSKVGGKAANLGELISAGFPVPPGFTVPATSYFEFLAATGLEPQIRGLLEGFNVNNTALLDLRAEEIQRLIIQAVMPEEMKVAIRQAYGQLDGGKCDVAVRSSATAEDLPDASFAGQQATLLNINGADDVVHAAQACMASLFGARAIFYRVEQGFDHMSVGLAAVVQKMVQSRTAGVMFTQNAIDGNPDHIQINAGYGLGEAVVSGSVTPDSYIVSKATGQIISRLINRQEKMLVRAPAGEGSPEEANIWVPVPGYLQEAQKISDEEILELAGIGRRVEQHYGGPQDTEWAIDEDGKVWLTQARPLTVDLLDYLLEVPLTQDESAPLLLRGDSTGPGVASGKVKILQGPSECDLVLDGDILVATMTTPDYVPAMKRAAAIVTEEGGATCHAAIVARELGVPCVVGVSGAIAVLGQRIGETITVDASHGEVFEGVAATRIAWNEHRLAALAELEARMANVKTGTKVMVILADPDEAPKVAAQNVDGVGLLRMEFVLNRIGVHPRQFMAEGRPEEYTAQIAQGIAALCEPFGDRPVILRLMDFKSNELAELQGGKDFESEEENPMLGLRGAIRYIQQPDVFALELAAIRQVRQTYKNLHVMVPFVRTPNELRETLVLMAEHGLRRGEDGLLVWMMAEVPSNVILLDEFIDEGLDGLSIGSNDLTQLILGRDRDNPRLGELDERDPAVMKAIERIVTGGRARGITVSICGQAPSNFPEVTRKLVEWGATSVSVTPDMLGKTRKIVADVERELASA